jgi:hypothetical protein
MSMTRRQTDLVGWAPPTIFRSRWWAEPTLQVIVFALMALTCHSSQATDNPAVISPSVGMPSKIEQLVLPGTELEPKPLEDRQAKLVVRIIEVFPHGSAFRYNLSYYGLEPGEYDLKDYLRRKDGGSTADLPKIPVTIRAILPPGQIEPNSLKPNPTFFWSTYRLWMALAIVFWIAGLLAILFVGRGKRKGDEGAGSVRPLTLADRLRPLVDRAMNGTLEPGQHAELERMLIGYWRKRLKLESSSPGQAIATIRSDEQAGPLLHQLEIWLHSPDQQGEVDVAALLEPYRHLPAEAMEMEGGPAIAGRVG